MCLSCMWLYSFPIYGCMDSCINHFTSSSWGKRCIHHLSILIQGMTPLRHLAQVIYITNKYLLAILGTSNMHTSTCTHCTCPCMAAAWVLSNSICARKTNYPVVYYTWISCVYIVITWYVTQPMKFTISQECVYS